MKLTPRPSDESMRHYVAMPHCNCERCTAVGEWLNAIVRTRPRLMSQVLANSAKPEPPVVRLGPGGDYLTEWP